MAALAKPHEDVAERQRLMAKLRGLSAMGASEVAYKGHAGEIVECLTSVDARVREAACATLAELDEVGVPFVDQVLKLLDLQELDREVRRQAVNALGACGGGSARAREVAATLDQELGKPDMQAPALRAMTKLGLVRGRGAELARLATSPQTHVRAAALTALGSLGKEAAPHASLVAGRLSEPVLRIEALQVLARLGEPAAEFISEVADCLRDSDPDCRVAAAEALRTLGRLPGSKQERTAKKALELLELPDERLKAAGITTLGCLGEKAEPYVKDIAAFLAHTSTEQQAPAPGSEAPKEPVTPYSDFDMFMIAVFGKPQAPPAKVAAVEQRKAAQPEPPPQPQLPPALRKPSCAAALALARLGTQGRGWAGAIGKMVVAGDPDVRLAALEAVGEMGPRALREDSVVKCMEDGSAEVRAAALSALGAVARQRPPEGLPPLLLRKLALALADAEPSVCRAAARALAEVGGPTAMLHSGKVAELLRKDKETVLTALEVLGSLGSEGAAVVNFTVDGIDFPQLRTLKAAYEKFQELVKEALVSQAPGAEVHLTCFSVGFLGAGVKAVLVRPGTEAEALVKALDGKKFAASLAGTMAQGGFVQVILRDQQPVVGSVRVCSQAGQHAAQVARLLEASTSAVRAAAANALACMGEASAPHAVEVARCLQDPFSPVRCAACEALGRMGRQLPADVLARLEATAADGGFGSVKAAATEALQRLKG